MNIPRHLIPAGTRDAMGIGIQTKPPRAVRDKGRMGLAKARACAARARKYVDYKPHKNGEVTLPLYLPSLANLREHWTKRRQRGWDHHLAVEAAMCGKQKPKLPVRITFTRLGPVALDDDNNQGSCKNVRDAMAFWLGVDDGNRKLFRCEYLQEISPAYGVRIRIESV